MSGIQWRILPLEPPSIKEDRPNLDYLFDPIAQATQVPIAPIIVPQMDSTFTVVEQI